MPGTSRGRAMIGEWRVTFEARTETFDCRHRPTGARVTGQVEFTPEAGAPMSARPGQAAGQWLLCDAQGDGQLVLRVNGTDRDLTFTLASRSRRVPRGRFGFRGTAALGSETFACRTFPPAQTRVVQMASGAADSTLNDSLFDIARDLALRLRAERVSITTEPGEEPVFAIALEGQAAEAAASEFTISVQPDFYRSRYVPSYRPLDKGRLPLPPTGWMSWNTYFDQAGEQENLDEARLGAKYLKPYGLEIWSIESWQDNSAKLPVSQFHNLTLRPYAKQFPHGMKWLAKQIRRLGFVPGLWTVPFGTGDEEFYRSHKRWFLHHPDGRPMSNWCGRYLLDPSQPAVRRYLMESTRQMAEWGYDFHKIDGMTGGRHYSALFYEIPEVRAAFRQPCENPYELCVQALRKGLGPDRIFLACGGHFGWPEVAVCDAARIGGDVVEPDHPVEWRGYVAQASMILSTLFVHGIVWYCDPDTLLVGAHRPLTEARVPATAIALAGQVTFAGDKLGELPPARRWLLQRCLPVCDVRPLDLYPIHELLPVWDLKVRRPFGQWEVVSLFNFGEANRELTVGLAELGLDAEKQYLVYDFWAGRLLGRCTDRVTLVVGAHANRLLAIHEDLGRPQFLSTDRHLTQGATSLSALKWDARRLTLSGKVALVAGEESRLVFAVPSGYRLEAHASTRAESRIETGENGTVTLVLSNRRGGTAAWELQFAMESV